jgi:uncharacterized protein YqjF (DUF2071 family)
VLNDFPTEIVIDRVAHRPWPMPDAPWLMTQSWHDLLFAHWPVDARELRERMPAGLELELYDGQAWIGIVPFDMTNVAPRFVPAIPGISAFPELNVRTYVTMGGKPGIYFFSLDAESSVAVALARTLLKLPYYTASMDVTRQDGWVDYWSERHAHEHAAPAEFEGRYRPVGPVEHAVPGTLTYFLTERYCLYNVDDQFKAYRLQIHHPPWELQLAEADITVNTMADAAGIRLPSMAPLLHYSRRQDMVAWAPERL